MPCCKKYDYIHGQFSAEVVVFWLFAQNVQNKVFKMAGTFTASNEFVYF